MDTLEECLDHILLMAIKSMNTREECIIHYGFKTKGVNVPTKEFLEMFTPLGFSQGDLIEAVKILTEKGYVISSRITPKNGYIALDLNKGRSIEVKDDLIFCEEHKGEVDYIVITLKGKFFRLQGGFQGEETARNRDKARIVRHDAQIKLLTYVIAFGTLVAAIYYTWDIYIHYHPLALREYFPSH